VLEGHRCGHTGTINYFSKTEPRLAVGCIIECRPGRFVWHCHVADDHAGAASDRRVAESELRRAIRSNGKRPKARS
jgi:hypothetical protein